MLILIALIACTDDAQYSCGIDNASYHGVEAAIFAHESDQVVSIFPMDHYAILAGDAEGESVIVNLPLEVNQWRHYGMGGDAFVIVYEWRHVTVNAPGSAIACPWDDYVTDDLCYAVY